MDLNDVGKREQRILDIMNDVKKSKQSARKYFSTIKQVSQTEEVQFAGFEIISALTYHTGIVDAWSDAIKSTSRALKIPICLR